MLVEHTFQSAFAAGEGVRIADAFLSALGYQIAMPCSKCKYDLRGSIPAGTADCPECGTPIAASIHHDATIAKFAVVVIATRQGKPGEKAKHKLLEKVRVEFQQTRVSVAASITTPSKKENPLHAVFLKSLAIGLEQSLRLSRPIAETTQPLMPQQENVFQDAKKAARKRIINAIVVVGVIVGLFALLFTVIAVNTR